MSTIGGADIMSTITTIATITAILLRIVLATSYAAHDTRAALLGLLCLVAGCAIGSPRSLASTHLL